MINITSGLVLTRVSKTRILNGSTYWVTFSINSEDLILGWTSNIGSTALTLVHIEHIRRLCDTMQQPETTVAKEGVYT